MNHKQYIPAAATNVELTFRKFGYVPPSELPEYQAKWSYYKSLHLIGDGHEETQQNV